MTGTDAMLEARLRVEQNLAAFSPLVHRAGALARRRPAQAAAMAQAAAQFAWFNHTGWFASAELERVLRDLGRSFVVPDAVRAPRTLHVVTQLYQTGGSTQAVASWTDEASERRHEVVVTAQGGTPIPAKIADRVGERVRLTRLDTTPGSLLARAERLRRLASRAELVLVHAHPHDVVPSLAFAERGSLPTIVYVDHADHVFWLGVSTSDYLLSMRRSGRDLALARRGADPARSLTMNRPLAVRSRTVDRASAKAEWGLASDQTLIVTAADPSKFNGSDGPSLVDLVEPAIHARQHLHWLIAGPSPDTEPWSSLAERTGGRARAVGSLSDMRVLHQAADLYLDSYPFASLTSMLESGAYGNPVVTYRGHDPSCAVFGADSPGIDAHMHRPETPPALVETLLRLCDDEPSRRASGEATAAAVVTSHTGDGWRRSADALYELARPRSSDSTGTPVHDIAALDLLTASFQARSPFSRSAEETVLSQLGVMPSSGRLTTAARAISRDEHVPLKALAPDWVIARLRSRWARASA